jgi:hypothetical protein
LHRRLLPLLLELLRIKEPLRLHLGPKPGNCPWGWHAAGLVEALRARPIGRKARLGIIINLVGLLLSRQDRRGSEDDETGNQTDGGPL